MGSDKMTKKLGTFIACGSFATALFAGSVMAAEPVKTAQPPVQAQVNASKLKAKAVKHNKSHKPKAVATPVAKVAPAK
jgi:hypothetical protein